MASLNAGVLHAWRFVMDHLNDRKHTNAVLKELRELGPDESRAILEEAGISTGDFRKAMRSPYATIDLSGKAFDALGVDRAAFRARNGAWDRDIQRTCMLCPSRRRCLRELTAGSFASNCGVFCPNSRNFDELTGYPEN